MQLLEDRPCLRCKKIYTPKVDWQKWCSDECHDEHWKEVYQERAAMNKRMEAVEKKVGIK